jgi:thymidylate synthase
MSGSAYGLTMRLDDFIEGYVDVVDQVMTHGAEASPRGLLTRELLAVTLIAPAQAPMLPIGTGRGVSTNLAAVEALQVMGGYSDAEALFAVNPHLRDFADQGAFHGAYGPRVRPQLDLVIRRLREDPESRRAVVTVWDPLRDSIEGVKNYPCTTQLQFLVRRGKLDCHVTMRANDAWHGLAYDAFVFSQLQATVANMLGVPVGLYVHQAASLHVYEEHWELTEKLAYPTADWPNLPHGLRSFEWARAIGDGKLVYSADESDRWYIRKAGHPQEGAA